MRMERREERAGRYSSKDWMGSEQISSLKVYYREHSYVSDCSALAIYIKMANANKCLQADLTETPRATP